MDGQRLNVLVVQNQDLREKCKSMLSKTNSRVDDCKALDREAESLIFAIRTLLGNRGMSSMGSETNSDASFHSALDEEIKSPKQSVISGLLQKLNNAESELKQTKEQFRIFFQVQSKKKSSAIKRRDGPPKERL